MRAEVNWSAENVDGGRVNERERDRAGFYEIEGQRRENTARKETKRVYAEEGWRKAREIFERG